MAVYILCAILDICVLEDGGGWQDSLGIEVVLVELGAGEGGEEQVEEAGPQQEHKAEDGALCWLTRHHLRRET